MDVFDRIFSILASESRHHILQIDATYIKAHRTACSLAKRGDVPCYIGRTKGGLSSRLHAVVNDEGKPVVMALIAGQTSDPIGTRIMYPFLPDAEAMIGDRGYGHDGYRAALEARGISSCISRHKG